MRCTSFDVMWPAQRSGAPPCSRQWVLHSRPLAEVFTPQPVTSRKRFHGGSPQEFHRAPTLGYLYIYSHLLIYHSFNYGGSTRTCQEAYGRSHVRTRSNKQRKKPKSGQHFKQSSSTNPQQCNSCCGCRQCSGPACPSSAVRRQTPPAIAAPQFLCDDDMVKHVLASNLVQLKALAADLQDSWQ